MWSLYYPEMGLFIAQLHGLILSRDYHKCWIVYMKLGPPKHAIKLSKLWVLINLSVVVLGIILIWILLESHTKHSGKQETVNFYCTAILCSNFRTYIYWHTKTKKPRDMHSRCYAMLSSICNIVWLWVSITIITWQYYLQVPHRLQLKQNETHNTLKHHLKCYIKVVISVLMIYLMCTPDVQELQIWGHGCTFQQTI